MKTCTQIAVGLVLWASMLPASAASPVASGSREALFVSDGIEGWSLGVDASSIRRDLAIEGFLDGLESTTYGGFIGWRGVPGLTLYTVLGHADANVGVDALGDGFYWSLGFQATVWQLDMLDPEFLSGRWSIRLGAEYASADLSSGEWQDVSASLRLQYEIFVESVEATQKIPYSLALYAGPMYSGLDGNVSVNGFGEDFEADEDLGLVAGIELSISHNVLLGIGVEYFDDVTWAGSLRYKF